MTGRAALVLVAMAACGDNLIPGPHVDANGRSGTRLEVHWNSVQDTWAPVTTSFHDVELDIECVPMFWDDGEWRCTIPGIESVFTDESCTAPIGRVVPGTDPVPNYVIVKRSFFDEFGVQREGVTGVFRRTPEPVGPRDATFTGSFETGCARLVEETYDYYGLGDEVGASRFATVYREEGPAGVLVPIDFSSDDGMHVRAGVRDGTGFDCDLQAREDGAVAYCAPLDPIEPEYFFDDTCRSPLGHRPGFYALHDDGGCPFYSGVFLSPGFTLDTVFRRAVDRCEEVPFAPATAVYQFLGGTRLTTTRLVDSSTTGRYRNLIVGTARGPVIADQLYDTVLDTDCRPDPETHRCVPIGNAVLVSLFESPTCEEASQQDIALVTVDCDVDQRFAGGRDGQRAYVVDATVITAQRYQRVDRGCVPFNPPAAAVMHPVSAVPD